MLRKACRVGHEIGAKAIVTGDSLGQVALQTLDNLLIISQASVLPILRPLIGLDKEEIVRMAKEMGTFEISIEPEEPCPFVPKYPVVRGSLGEFEKIREKLVRGGCFKASYSSHEILSGPHRGCRCSSYTGIPEYTTGHHGLGILYAFTPLVVWTYMTFPSSLTFSGLSPSSNSLQASFLKLPTVNTQTPFFSFLSSSEGSKPPPHIHRWRQSAV